MGMSPYIKRLRAAVGHDRLLVPTVAVLPVDVAGRLLLVQDAGREGEWSPLGGGVEIGESPAAAAVREAKEEIGVDLALGQLIDVLGGPDYEVTYPNGDQVACVIAVYEATIVRGVPQVADDELSDIAWFDRMQLPGLRMTQLCRALLRATCRL
jgi:8-oxo-dGTP pyrophosphatase MutT (NUDIX family)